MKIIKIFLVGVLIFMVFFVVFNKSKKLTIEGKWQTTKLVIDGTDVIASQEINRYFDVGNQTVFNYWNDSLTISTISYPDFNAKFKVENDKNNNYKILLSSRETALNGTFTMEVDTTHIGPQAYIVNLKIYLDNTILCLKRDVNIPPWKPEVPRKGQI